MRRAWLNVGYILHRVEEPGVKALICQDKWLFWKRTFRMADLVDGSPLPPY
jgi:hypothetical protein